MIDRTGSGKKNGPQKEHRENLAIRQKPIRHTPLGRAASWESHPVTAHAPAKSFLSHLPRRRYSIAGSRYDSVTVVLGLRLA